VKRRSLTLVPEAAIVPEKPDLPDVRMTMMDRAVSS
jgi:hypothetical protein